MTHLDEKALLPCPFCGKEPIFTRTVEDDNFDRWFHVRCEECAIEIGDEYRSDAINTWNRRASPALPSSPVSELVADLRDEDYRHEMQHLRSAGEIDRLFHEAASALTTLSTRNAELERGIDRLAAYIMENVPGEPSENQGAVDTAIRLLGKNAELEREVKRLREERKAIRDKIPMNYLRRHDAPGATGPTDNLDLVAAVKDFSDDRWELIDRVRVAEAALSTSPQGGEHE